VADAIRGHDPDLAQERHRQHWLRATRTALDVIETCRLRLL
jgi:hypothetical protein